MTRVLVKVRISNAPSHKPYEQQNWDAVVRSVHCTCVERRRGGASSVSAGVVVVTIVKRRKPRMGHNDRDT